MVRSSRFIALACFTSLIALGACSRQDGRQMAKPTDSQIAATNTTVAPSTSAGEFTDDVAAIDTEPALMTIIAPFTDGAVVSAPFVCGDAAQSPTLTWANVPAGTVSLAIILTDEDAPDYVHWVAAKEGVAFDHIQSANDSSRKVLARFGELPDALQWTMTFGAGGNSMRDLLLRYGPSIAATGTFAGSAGLRGEVRQLSESFEIHEDELRFTHLNFGGAETRIRLIVDWQIIHEKRGDRLDVREAVRFDTSSFRGRSAQLELVDSSPDPWDWVGIDDIVLATSTP